MSLTVSGTAAKASAKQPVQEPKTFFVQKVIGGDTYLVLATSQIEVEDEFSSLYVTSDSTGGTNVFMQPPFDPQTLLTLAQTNNTLLQCVEVMEVNVDGTGYEFVKAKDDVEIDKTELLKAESFFKEVFPGLSFLAMRRRFRRDKESIGYAYFEVLRNVEGEILAMRNVLSNQLRMVKLGDPELVEEKVERNGKDVTLSVWKRYRRFGQRIAGSTLVYYKEFGCKKHLHRETGLWETPENPVPEDKRATELLLSGIVPDVRSPYYVPRWINNLPSVVGSRKAEEQNLEFFDAGGMPPAIIFIQGGVLAADAADQLKHYLSGKNKYKHRAVVVEAQSSSGSLDASGTVQVKVERFGGEKANDALYSNYDKATEEHVRMAFRIPPLFLGKPADFNFATAITAYMVAEAQVFKPERDAFDELVNGTIIKEMGFKTLRIKSKPITLQDIQNQMKAIELAADAITPENKVKALNDITGLELEAKPTPPEGTPLGNGTVMGPDGFPVPAPKDYPDELTKAQEALTRSQAAVNDAKAGLKPGTSAGEVAARTPGSVPNAPMRKTAFELIRMAKDMAVMEGLLPGVVSDERAVVVKSEMSELDKEDRSSLMELLSGYAFGASSSDLVAITHHCSDH